MGECFKKKKKQAYDVCEEFPFTRTYAKKKASPVSSSHREAEPNGYPDLRTGKT